LDFGDAGLVWRPLNQLNGICAKVQSMKRRQTGKSRAEKIIAVCAVLAFVAIAIAS